MVLHQIFTAFRVLLKHPSDHQQPSEATLSFSKPVRVGECIEIRDNHVPFRKVGA
jgi:acyl-ACP thioesterase